MKSCSRCGAHICFDPPNGEFEGAQRGTLDYTHFEYTKSRTKGECTTLGKCGVTDVSCCARPHTTEERGWGSPNAPLGTN